MRRLPVGAIVILLFVAWAVMSLSAWQTPKYKASTEVRIETREASATGAEPPGIEAFTQTFAREVSSRSVAKEAVARLGIEGLSPDELLNNLTVEAELFKNPRFIRLTYTATNAKMAQVIANAVGQVASDRISQIRLGKSEIDATLARPATLPAQPVSPKPLRNGLIALVAGLALVSVVAVVRRRG